MVHLFVFCPAGWVNLTTIANEKTVGSASLHPPYSYSLQSIAYSLFAATRE